MPEFFLPTLFSSKPIDIPSSSPPDSPFSSARSSFSPEEEILSAELVSLVLSPAHREEEPPPLTKAVSYDVVSTRGSFSFAQRHKKPRSQSLKTAGVNVRIKEAFSLEESLAKSLRSFLKNRENFCSRLEKGTLEPSMYFEFLANLHVLIESVEKSSSISLKEKEVKDSIRVLKREIVSSKMYFTSKFGAYSCSEGEKFNKWILSLEEKLKNKLNWIPFIISLLRNLSIDERLKKSTGKWMTTKGHGYEEKKLVFFHSLELGCEEQDNFETKIIDSLLKKVENQNLPKEERQELVQILAKSSTLFPSFENKKQINIYK